MYEMQFVAVNCSSTAEVSAVELQLTGGPAWVLIVHFLELEVVLNSTYYTTTYYYYYYYYTTTTNLLILNTNANAILILYLYLIFLSTICMNLKFV